jgi:hypothetical protein
MSSAVEADPRVTFALYGMMGCAAVCAIVLLYSCYAACAELFPKCCPRDRTREGALAACSLLLTAARVTSFVAFGKFSSHAVVFVRCVSRRCVDRRVHRTDHSRSRSDAPCPCACV